MRARVAVSLGDPSGVGAEVTAKALAMPSVARVLTPIVFGDERLWREACRDARVKDRLQRVAVPSEARGPALVPVSALSARDSRPGKPGPAGGRAQLAYLERAITALKEGHADALCTAPVSKEQIARSGLHFTGHTELLAERFGARVLMLLAGPVLRVAVHTTHVAIAEVPGRIDPDGIVEDLRILDRGLKRLGIARPRIAVCGLNPHAGDGGLFGDEEARLIAPAIKRARRDRAAPGRRRDPQGGPRRLRRGARDVPRPGSGGAQAAALRRRRERDAGAAQAAHQPGPRRRLRHRRQGHRAPRQHGGRAEARRPAGPLALTVSCPDRSQTRQRMGPPAPAVMRRM